MKGGPEVIEVTLNAMTNSDGKVVLDPGTTSVARTDWGSGDGLTATVSLK
ncbi:MAG: hypothetical protein WBV82_20655 [Myxococcaceae bacterium]